MMRIKEIRSMRFEIPPREALRTKPGRPSWFEEAKVANPMSKHPRFKRNRSFDFQNEEEFGLR